MQIDPSNSIASHLSGKHRTMMSVWHIVPTQSIHSYTLDVLFEPLQ